ncbi:hypothetical protein Sjap_025622 [Stephania japonica]|uniref:Uncharacterized protein n=1 Tax=Stephania japonica TaxID=461633 RepID=A0AAP0E243_9MAGN
MQVASLEGEGLHLTSNDIATKVPSLERRNSLKKVSLKSTSIPPPLLSLRAAISTRNNNSKSLSMDTPISPKTKSPKPLTVKSGNDPNGLNFSANKTSLTPRATPKLATLVRKKSKKSSNGGTVVATAAADSVVSLSHLKNIFFVCAWL